MTALAHGYLLRVATSRRESYLRLIFAGVMGIGASHLCGCHKTVMVFGPSALPAALAQPADDSAKAKAAKNELPGIPFYNHMGVCTHESVWLEPQTTLSLTVTPDGGKPTTRMIVLNNRAFHDQNPQGHDANSLVTALEQIEGKHDREITALDKRLCPANVAAGWDAVRDAYKVTPIDEKDVRSDEQNQILVLISNTAAVGTAVDYSRVYYLNARSRLIGTGTVDAKLNTDGTLSEGSASVDDETLGDILTAAATVGSGGLTAWSTVAAAKITASATAQAPPVALEVNGGPPKPPACEANDGWPEVKESVVYDFTVSSGGFKHDHKIVVPLEEEDKGECSATGIVVGGSFSVTPAGDSGKSDKDAIQVSGSITMPKAKDSEKPKP